MDNDTAKLVADLSRHLSVELDLNYEDVELARYNVECVDAIQRALLALAQAKAFIPDAVEHILVRAENGQRQIQAE